MERKYLLKLEGRSTRCSEVFFAHELDSLVNALSGAVAHFQSLQPNVDNPLIEPTKKLINVLQYNKPCD